MEGQQQEGTTTKPPRSRKRATAAAPETEQRQEGEQHEGEQTAAPGDEQQNGAGEEQQQSEGDETQRLAQELHDSQTAKSDDSPLAGTGLAVEETSKEDELKGQDTKPRQPYLGGPDSQKVGMAPKVPQEVLDAAHAVVNARAEHDRAGVKFAKAAEVFVARADKHSLRMVRVTDDIVLRLERPEARLKMDGYKKPASENAPTKKKREAKEPKAAKPKQDKKPSKSKKPTKAEREASAKTAADAAQKARTGKSSEKGNVADLSKHRSKKQGTKKK